MSVGGELSKKGMSPLPCSYLVKLSKRGKRGVGKDVTKSEITSLLTYSWEHFFFTTGKVSKIDVQP